MGPLRLRPSAETLRWAASFTMVLSVHGAAALLALEWGRSTIPAGAPPAAMLIDLAPAAPEPEPVAPEEDPLPPEPEKEIVQETPPPPEPEPPPPEPIVEPEVALPTLPPPEPPPVEQPPAQETPPPELAPPAIAAAAPQVGNSALPAGAIATWQTVLLAHLERHKRYPREAQWLKQEGVVEVHFVMDREGRVLTTRIENSSDSEALDREAIEMLARAQPLPEPPEEIRDATLELVVPVQFALKR